MIHSMKGDRLTSENLKVLVFHSNINSPPKVSQVRNVLLADKKIYQVDIDLKDSENVLRVECHPDCMPELIKKKVASAGFRCGILI
ncbi:MAG TPA: hypothetical protein VK112_10580 [Fodinibius sp.]|nr:hypothetical protein [Fodinibius sp.]